MKNKWIVSLGYSLVSLHLTAVAQPAVTNLAASGVTATSATLQGTVDPMGLPATAYFQYGTNTNYGRYSETNSLAETNVALSVTNRIRGLAPTTTYHFQLVASNSEGTAFGPDLSFTTTRLPRTNSVITLADSGPGSLRDAIDNAAPGDTIVIATNGTLVLTNGELVIVSSLTIDASPLATLANGFSIDGNSGSRIFRITNSSSVVLKSLTMANGCIPGRFRPDPFSQHVDMLGGGIFNGAGCTLTLIRCLLATNRVCVTPTNHSYQGNGARFAGGAIFNAGNLLLDRTSLSGNYAIGFNAGLAFGSVGASGGQAFGGGIFNDLDATLTLDDCAISTNAVVGGTGAGERGAEASGGGIYHTGATLTLNRTTLSGNTATGGTGGGGPIFALGDAYDGGWGSAGAIYQDNGVMTLNQTTLVGNSAVGGTGGSARDSSYDGGDGGGGVGGGIQKRGGAMTIRQSTIAFNAAVPGRYGLGRPGFRDPWFFPVGYDGSDGFGWSGGIVTTATNDTLQNTLLALNVQPSGFNLHGPDLTGIVLSLGHNLLTVTNGSEGIVSDVNGDLAGSIAAPLDPRLGSLADNGGPTLTLALQPGSPAIDAGDDSLTSTFAYDQRGTSFLRRHGSRVDIGAYEFGSVSAARWYIGPPALGNDLSIYYQAAGGNVAAVDGAASRIGQAIDGSVVVENSIGKVYARLGSTNGVGTGWQLLTSVTAGDGATWFLGSDGVGDNFRVYRWAASDLPAYSDGDATQMNVLADGSILVRNSGETSYVRVGSNTGLGSSWRIVAGVPAVLTKPLLLGSGGVQFSFSSQPGASFTVLMSTNVALPWSNWISLGATVENPAGQYQFTDLPATNQWQRFYRIRSP